MAAIINAIFGTYPEPVEEQPVPVPLPIGTSTGDATVIGNVAVSQHSANNEDITVKSVINTETQSSVSLQNQAKINQLMALLGTTHSQIDLYSRQQTEQITESVQNAIQQVLFETQQQQEKMLIDAQNRQKVIDQEHKQRLQKCIEQLDQIKAAKLAELEKDLHIQQGAILNSAKLQVDRLNNEANQLKINVLKEAGEQVKHDIANLTDQVATLGQQEAQHCIQSTTTTTITTESQATGETSVQNAGGIIVSENAPIRTESQIVGETVHNTGVVVTSEPLPIPMNTDSQVLGQINIPNVVSDINSTAVPVTTETSVQNNTVF